MRCPIVSLPLPCHPTDFGVKRIATKVVSRLVCYRERETAPCYNRVPCKAAVDRYILCSSVDPRLRINRRRTPEQIIGNAWKDALEMFQQIHRHIFSMSPTLPIEILLFDWPVKEAHQFSPTPEATFRLTPA